MIFKYLSCGALFWIHNVKYIKTQSIIADGVPYNAVICKTGEHAFVSDEALVHVDVSSFYRSSFLGDESCFHDMVSGR